MSVTYKNIYIFLALTCYFFVHNFIIHDNGFINNIVFFIIATSSAGVIFVYNQKGVTFLKIFFLFSLVFFGFVPPVELFYKKIYWGGGEFEEGSYAAVGLIVLFLNSMVMLSYLATGANNKQRSVSIMRKVEKFELNTQQSIVIVLLCFISAFITMYMNSFNLFSLIFRGGELTDRVEITNSSLGLIFGSCIRFLPMSTALVLLYTTKGKSILKLFLVTLGILCAFPTGIARLMVATYYLPLLVFIMPSLVRSNRVVILLTFGLLFAFPFLDLFRRFSFDNDINFIIDYKYMLGGHFDAFQNLVRIITVDLVTYGYQILGAIFFFLPRILWSTKPVGTGVTLADSEGYVFTNISATWYAEGWANFGLIGSILFALIIGYFMCKLDRRYWFSAHTSYFSLIYIVGLGYMFFFLRGDLLNGVAFLFGTLFAFWLPYKILLKLRSKQ